MGALSMKEPSSRLRSPFHGLQLLKKPSIAADHSIGRISLLHGLDRRGAQPVPQRLVVEKPGKRLLQHHRVARLHEQPVDVVGQNILDSAVPARHGGEAARHRLDQGDAESLVRGREGEDIPSLKIVLYIADITGERDRCREFREH